MCCVWGDQVGRSGAHAPPIAVANYVYTCQFKRIFGGRFCISCTHVLDYFMSYL